MVKMTMFCLDTHKPGFLRYPRLLLVCLLGDGDGEDDDVLSRHQAHINPEPSYLRYPRLYHPPELLENII
jgi:hypothetical protein